jgi:ribosomal protein S18 acetylase RimI-like enzyme
MCWKAYSRSFVLENDQSVSMNQPIDIRPLEEADFSRFIDIQREALASAPELFGSDYDWFESLSLLSIEQRFEKYQNFPSNYLLGAFTSSGSIVGMIGFSCESHLAKLRHRGKVWGLYVSTEMRRQGLASRLLETVIETARDVMGCEQIQLSVSKHNEASYALYLRLGFVVYGTDIHAMKIEDGYVDEYLMVKFLR